MYLPVGSQAKYLQKGPNDSLDKIGIRIIQQLSY
jgi:hypothetical protein